MVRALREQALLTQEELAARTGLSVSMIRNLESGRIRRPRGSSVRALADALAPTDDVRQRLMAAAANELDAEGVSVAPAQLPPDVSAFTGRDHEVAHLDALLNTRRPTAMVISAVSGTAGVGKTALAIHWAHSVADRFPDGQLYVNLRGYDPDQPMAPGDALARFLAALGIPNQSIPAEVDERASRYRTELAGRRVLIVLDNAATAEQVRPLLPGTPSCTVVVTSRDSLAGLVAVDGARRIDLDLLPTGEAISLLRKLIGGRVDTERDAAATLAEQCARLPLALRVAAELAVSRRTTRLADLVAELADQRRRLELLAAAGDPRAAVTAVFSWSIRHLPPEAARTFRLLGLHPGPDFDAYAAAALADAGLDHARRDLDLLARAHLVRRTGGSRYAMHDLLRAYAAGLATAECTETDARNALTRLFDFYLATAWRTLALLRPGDPRLQLMDARRCIGGLEFDDATAALAWLETERANLLAAVEQAAGTASIPDEMAIQLAHALFGFLLVRNYYADLERINQTALRAARRTGDQAAQAQSLSDLGSAFWQLARYEQALACFRDSLTVRRQLGDRRGQAASLGNLSVLHGRQKQYAQALTCEQESLAIYRELSDNRGQAVSLGNLGIHHERLGQYDQALACQQESLTLNREFGDRRAQAVSLNNLGTVHGLLGHYDQALACLQESLTICRELGDRWVAAASLHDLGVVHHRQGRFDRALAFLQESLAACRDLGDRHGQGESLRDLGVTLLAQGRREDARAAWLEALAIFEQLRATDADQIRIQLLPNIENESGRVEMGS